VVVLISDTTQGTSDALSFLSANAWSVIGGYKRGRRSAPASPNATLHRSPTTNHLLRQIPPNDRLDLCPREAIILSRLN